MGAIRKGSPSPYISIALCLWAIHEPYMRGSHHHMFVLTTIHEHSTVYGSCMWAIHAGSPPQYISIAPCTDRITQFHSIFRNNRPKTDLSHMGNCKEPPNIINEVWQIISDIWPCVWDLPHQHLDLTGTLFTAAASQLTRKLYRNYTYWQRETSRKSPREYGQSVACVLLNIIKKSKEQGISLRRLVSNIPTLSCAKVMVLQTLKEPVIIHHHILILGKTNENKPLTSNLLSPQNKWAVARPLPRVTNGNKWKSFWC